MIWPQVNGDQDDILNEDAMHRMGPYTLVLAPQQMKLFWKEVRMCGFVGGLCQWKLTLRFYKLLLFAGISLALALSPCLSLCLCFSVSFIFHLCLFHFPSLSLSCLPVSMFLSFSLFLSSSLVAFLHVPHHDAYDSHFYNVSPSYGFCYKFPQSWCFIAIEK